MQDLNDAQEKLRVIATQSVAGAGAAGLGYALGGLEGALVGGAARAPLTEALEQAQRQYRSWRQRRAEVFQDALLDMELTAEDLALLACSDERKAELLREGYQEAVETHYREKTAAIGRAVRSGLLASDSAKIDLARVITRTMRELEPSHVRVLLALEAGDHDDAIAHHARGGMKVKDLVADGLGDSEALDAHLSFLQAHGLVRGMGQWVDPRMDDHWTPPGWDITSFGISLLEFWADLPS